MKLAIVGSRNFTDYDLFRNVVSTLDLSNVSEIVSGGAAGADSLASRFASEIGIPVTEFLPDWSLGRAAGPIRNKKIVEASNALLAFWDGKSPGTKSSIEMARKKGIPVHVVTVE